MMKQLYILPAVLCTVLLVSSSPAWAQLDTATVVGTVVDAQHAVVPGVSVTARNVLTGFTRTGVTDGGGPAAVTVTDTSPVASATPFPRARTVTALLPGAAVGDADKVKMLVVAPALSTAGANVPVTPSGSPSAESVTSAVKAVRTIEISPAATDVP